MRLTPSIIADTTMPCNQSAHSINVRIITAMAIMHTYSYIYDDFNRFDSDAFTCEPTWHMTPDKKEYSKNRAMILDLSVSASALTTW